MSKSYSRFLLTVIFLVSCGGGGGGGGSDSGGSGGGGGGGGSISFPSVSISSDKEDAEVNTQVTLSWSSTDATSCSASGAWSGTKGTSGSEAVTVSQAGANTYSLSCSNSSGSASSSVSVLGYRTFNGVAFDGYLSGAEIFIDENSNAQQDSNEYSATTDGNGAFNLRYTDGVLISKNGTDVDTQTALSNYVLEHKLSGYTESKVISPITTLAAYFADSSKLNAALGLDSTLDITITDPIPNKGDKGPYDYLYEKGTQATVLALALTNIANNGFNQSQTTTTQTTFDLIAKELEAQYTESNARVDIEREDFLAKVVERLSATLSTTISDANKTTVSRALSNVLPVVEVKDNAEVTVAAMRFGLNLFQQDIAKLAAGTASNEVVTAYKSNILGYIAADQGVSAEDLAPNITAIDDNVTIDEDTEGQFNVLNNDSYLTAYEIGLSITSDPSHGSISVTGGTVTYQPDLNYNGSDSFTYQITQGTKVSSATVNITINPINDAPELNFSSSFSVNENSTLVGVMSANDVDGDQLEVSLSGTNADLFTIDSNTFELNFKEAPDYESGNVSFAVTIVVKDAEFTVSRDIAITVNNLNDNAPSISGPTEVTIAENGTTFVGNYDFSDADGDSVSITFSGVDSNLVKGTNRGSYVEVALKQPADFEDKGQYFFDVVAADGSFSSSVSVIVNITNEFEELTSFSYMDNPITTNSDGTFISGDDASGGRPVFFMQFPGTNDWDGWYARDYGASQTRIAASATGTEFVTAEKNGSCTQNNSGQGAMVIYVYDSYTSYPKDECYADGIITGNGADISYDGKRIATHVYQDNDHGIAIYDYLDSGTKLFKKVQTLNIGSNGFEGNGIALSGDGLRVAWAAVDEISVREFDPTVNSINTIFISNEEAYSVDLNGNGSILVFSNKLDGEVEVWDISSASSPTQIGYFNQDTWSAEPFNLNANDTNDWSHIEVSLDQSGTGLALGFPNADNNVRDTGKVALFSYTGQSWELYHLYNSSSNTQGSNQGYVALTNDASKVVIGTENENSGFFEAFPNRNKNPQFSLDTSNDNFVMPENTTRVTAVAATDDDNDDISYLMHGRDAQFFELKDGFLQFKEAPNFENPKSRDSSNTYSVTVKATDQKNYDYRFFEVDVQNVSETAPTYQIWGESRQYRLGLMDMELSKDGKRLVVLSDDGSSFKDIDVYEYDGNNYNLYHSRSCYLCLRISISGDGNHIAYIKGNTSSSLDYCNITNSNNVQCRSLYTAGQFTSDPSDVDLNFDATAVIVGSAEFNNNIGRAELWKRTGIDQNWNKNLGDSFTFSDVGFTGKRVQINDDGSRVAVLANRNIDATGNPAVRIYELQESGDYDEVDIIRSEFQMNGFGTSLDWSSDGRYIVIGSPDPRSNGSADPGTLRNGAVFIYDCSNTTPNNNSECTQLGNTIIGDYENEWFGWNVAINDGGDLILASSLKYPDSDASGEVRQGRVKAYSLSNDAWSPTGYEFIGRERGNQAGNTLDLSSDASFGVFSEPYASSGAYQSGTIHVLSSDCNSGWVEPCS